MFGDLQTNLGVEKAGKMALVYRLLNETRDSEVCTRKLDFESFAMPCSAVPCHAVQ